MFVNNVLILYLLIEMKILVFCRSCNYVMTNDNIENNKAACYLVKTNGNIYIYIYNNNNIRI